MTFLKSIKYKIFGLAFLFIVSLSFFSWCGAIIHSEGGINFVVNLFYGLCYILMFPFCYLFVLLKVQNEYTLILGYFLNSVVYSFIIERIYTKYKLK